VSHRIIGKTDERTYRGPDVDAVSDAVDIDVIVMAGVVEERDPVDTHGALATGVLAPIWMDASRAGEVAVHCHRRVRGRRIEQGPHDGHAA
jgi:hypothetical protein